MYSFLWVYLHRLVKLPVPMEPLSIPPMSQRCPSFACRVYVTYIQSPFSVMLLFEGSWNLSHPFLSYLDFACWPFPVQLLVHALYDRFLPHYTALLSTSCWMMGDDLITSFQWISSHWLQTLRLAVISGRFSCHPQFLRIHQCPLINGSSPVFDLNTSIHTCEFPL